METTVPAWATALRLENLQVHPAAGHVWIRFHRWAFQRYPSNDLAPVGGAEARDLFFRAGAPVISHHHLPEPGEVPNALLYLCRDPGYGIEKLSANNRSKVRRGLKRFEVRRARPEEMERSGYRAYADRCRRNGLAVPTEEAYAERWRGSKSPFAEVWGVFAEGGEVAAYADVRVCGDWAEIVSSQSADAHLRDYPNHALFYTVLHDLLRLRGIRTVSYGLSSVQAVSRMESLHQFKLSVGLEAVPVVRRITVNPLLRPAVNPVTRAAVRAMERRAPRSLLVRTARGALELMMGPDEAGLPREGESVAPLERRDVDAVAALHRAVFPAYDSTRLGTGFCRALYGRWVEHPEAFGFVALHEGRPAGFVAGGAEGVHEAVNASLRRRALAALALRPHLLLGARTFRRIGRALRRRTSAPAAAAASAPRAETREAVPTARLVLIGVAAEARGTGAARALMDAFAAEARRRGFARLTLGVARENARARAAYEKAGWTLVDDGGESVEYVLDLPAAAPA